MPNYLRRFSLVKKLAVIVLFVTLSVFAVLMWFVGQRTSSMVEGQATQGMHGQLDMLMETFSVFDRNITQSTQALGNVFYSMFPEGVELVENTTERVGTYDAPVLRTGGERLNLNFSKPDEFTRVTSGNATVFVRYKDDFLRVTTSLKKENGERATGTLLGKTHPGYSRLINGQPYLGKARLFGRDYMTEYRPVKDSSGRVIAILYVGFDFTEVFASLKTTLAEISLGKTGYAFLVDGGQGERQGTLIVHPEHEGSQIQSLVAGDGSTPLGQMLEADQGQFSYPSRNEAGKVRIVVFKRIPGWNMIAGMNQSLDELTAVSRRLGWELAVFTLVAAGLIVGLMFFMLNSQLKPLKQISESLARIGEGDLTVRRESAMEQTGESTDNEIALLRASIDRMVGEFRNLVSGILDTTGDLNQSAGRLAQLTDDSRSRLTDQSNRTDQLATAVTEMVASIQEVAHSVAAASAATKDANDKTVEGQSTVSEAERTIRDVAEQGEKASHVIATLKSESENIGSVIDVIRGIAEQTNLLALNAAIEAARAGDQGRGFAVVADEVRGLAQRTQESTSQIQEMIVRLQSEATTAVAYMETSRDYGQRGVEKATAAAHALTAIEASARSISDMITQVADAAEEQSAVAEDINVNVVGIRDLSESTATSAEETALASERLAGLAVDLKTHVDRFRI